MGLPHVSHIHSTIPFMKVSQVIESADCNWVLDYQLILKYQVQPLV